MKDVIYILIQRAMKNKSIRNGVLFSGFSFVNKGISFLLLMVLANLMTPAEYGYLNLFNTIIMILGVVIALSSEGYLSVAYFQEGMPGTKKTFSVVSLTATFIFLLLTGVIFIGSKNLSSSLELPQSALYMALLISFFTVFNNVFLDYNRIKEKIKVYGFFSFGCALLNLIVSLYFVGILHWGWEGRVYAQFLCMLLFGGIGLCYFVTKGFFTSECTNHFKPIFFWCLPLIPHAATNFIRQGCDRYIINYYHTIDDVGLFSMGLTLVNIITMIGFGFNQSISVDIYKTLSDSTITKQQKKNKLLKQRKGLMTIYGVTTLFSIVATYLLLPIILPQYTSSVKYFLILSIYGFGVCVYLLYTNYLFFYKKTKLIMYITFGSAVIHLLLSLIVTKYSLVYTAMIYGLTQIIVVLFIRRNALKTISVGLRENI